MRPVVRHVDRLQRLATFEAAARLGSFSAAGRELGLAQPAVTRQLQALERDLGMDLFHREANRSRLTGAGQSLADAVDAGFATIERSLTELLEPRSNLVLAMPPGFAQQLVVPRLDSLEAAIGDLDLRLWLYDRASHLTAGSFDAAVRVGSAPWDGYEASDLFAERVMPVATPALASEWGLDVNSSAEAVLAAPLLHMDSTDRPWMSWSGWLDEFDLALTPGRRVEFTNYPAVLQQAVAGKGVALAWVGLTNELIDSDVLRVVGPEVTSSNRYMVTWAAGHRTAAFDAVVSWLEHVGN